MDRWARLAWSPGRRRATRDGLVLAGLLLTAFQLLAASLGFSDADAYRVASLDLVYRDYDLARGVGHAYTPAFAVAMAPLAALPDPLFRLLWAALALVALRWLAGPVPPFWRLPFLLLCLPEVINGNVHLPLAAAIAVGARRPWAWSLVLLTKVAPGVGLAWFAARREWRQLAVAGAATLALAAVAWLVAPDLWPRWVATVAANLDASGSTLVPQVPILVRLPVALAVALLAGHRGWRPGIALAAFMALPHLVLTGTTVLAAIPRLRTAELDGADPYGAGGEAGAAAPAARRKTIATSSS